MEEAHIYDTLNNLSNVITSDAFNLVNLTFSNAKLAEQLKVALAQNKGLTDLLNKRYAVA